MKRKINRLSLLGVGLAGVVSTIAIPLATSCKTTDKTVANLTYEKVSNGYEVTGISNAGKDITTITVPSCYNGEKVVSIKEGALKNCPNLITLNVPFIGKSEDATGIEGMIGYGFGTDMYEGCGGITWQEIDNPDGSILYGSYAIPITLINVNVTNAKRIPDGAFSKCKNIENVKITNSSDYKVTEIGNKSFYFCSSLTSFDFAFSSELKKIGKAAFERCYTLDQIIIPNSVEVIDEMAFANCISAARAILPENVKTVSSKAFTNFIGGIILTQDDEDTIVKTKKWATDWTETSTVTIFDFKSGNTYKYVDDWLIIMAGTNDNKYGYISQWMGDYKQESVTIPSEFTSEGKTYPIKVVGCKIFNENMYVKKVTISEGIKYIFPNAFYYCTALKYVNFPESLLEIRADAFNGCSNLIGYLDPENETEVNAIDFKNVTKLGDRAFKGCSSITTLNIDKIESIGEETFAHCSHLSGTLTFPKSCLSVGKGAFKYCFKYAPQGFTESVYYPTVTICDTATVIPESCFEGCGVRVLTSIADEDKGVTYPKKIRINIDLNGAPLTKIDNAAFKHCWINQLSGARNTVLEYIGDYSFYYAQPISDIEGSKTDLQIDQECEYVGQYAFAYCTTIESLTFLTENQQKVEQHKHSLKHLGQYAFYGINNTKFTTLDLSPCLDLETSYEASVLDVNANSARYAFAQCPYLEVVYLPGSDKYRDTPKGYKTTYTDAEGKEHTTNDARKFNELSERFFDGCTNIGKDGERTPIIIGDFTKTLRAYAFNGCNWLQNVYIQSAVDFYGSCLFQNCTSLVNITKKDGSDVDMDPTLYRDHIGSDFYKNCYELTKAPIPVGRIKAETEAGKGESYSIHDYFYINSSAFMNCMKLKEIKIPATISSFGTSAFQGCLGLTKVTIDTATSANYTKLDKSKLTSIGTYAFSGCSSLETFDISKCTSGTFTINTSAFLECTSLGLNSKLATAGKFKLPNTKLSVGTAPFGNWTKDQTVYFSLTNATYSGKGQTFTYPETFTLWGTSWTLKRIGAADENCHYVVVGAKDGSVEQTIDGVKYGTLQFKYDTIA